MSLATGAAGISQIAKRVNVDREDYQLTLLL
jgi:hypothetical protein